MTIKEMTERRSALVASARAIYETAKTENREPTTEERSAFDQFMTDADAMKADMDRLTRLETEERSLSESRGRITEPQTRTVDSAGDPLRLWLSNENGPKSFALSLRNDPLRSMGERFEWEQRALSVGTDSAGGYTAPDEFANALEVALLAHDGMRSVASVIRTGTGNPLPWPTVDDTDNEGVLLDENVAAEELDAEFGQKTFGSYKVSSKIIRVSRELLQDSAINIASVVGELLGVRIGRALNRLHTVGTGVSQFSGAVTGATASGVTTATLGDVTWQELVQIEHSVDPSYRAGAVFMFNDATLAVIKQLVDGNNRPLFLPGITAGAPGTLLGYPVVINQHMADLSTASAKSIMFGAMSKFKIRDVSNITIVRADERYFEYDQVAFHGLYRGDSGMLDAGSGPVRYAVNAAA